MKNTGNNIRKLRKELKLTQQELANEAGLTQITISNIERGHNWNRDTLLAIKDVLGCNMIDLLTD